MAFLVGSLTNNVRDRKTFVEEITHDPCQSSVDDHESRHRGGHESLSFKLEKASKCRLAGYAQ